MFLNIRAWLFTVLVFLPLSVLAEEGMENTPRSVKFIELPTALQQVALCESGAKHYDAKGRIIKSHTKDYGIFQINHIHWDYALRQGYDVFSPNGNMAYALYLYRRNGLNDWLASRACWSKHVAYL